jgi:hypothetical protein
MPKGQATLRKGRVKKGERSWQFQKEVRPHGEFSFRRTEEKSRKRESERGRIEYEEMKKLKVSALGTKLI